MPHDRSSNRAGDNGSKNRLLGRRACLKGLGGVAAAVGAVGVPTGTAAAATTRRGIEFDRVVDVVDDLGCDPTGGSPVQKKISNAEQEGTLFVFPEGEYLLTDRLLLLYNDVVGILGEGDARFVVPENYNDQAVIIDRGERLLFENVDLDLRADGATPGYKFGAHDTAEIRDVELIGQGIHPNSDPRGEGWGNPEVCHALHLIARTSGASVTVENYVARNRGLMGAYNHGKGRTGVWVGRSNEGTVTMRNCHFSGFPNNGLYTSRTPGVVQVEGGVFRNNDISQVRLGSEGSYVEGALIEVDPTTNNSPNPEDMLNGRGVRIESGPVKTGGVTVRDCDIHIAENSNSEGGVIVAGAGGEFDVVDTRIKIDSDWTHGVRAKRPADGNYAPPWPRRGRLKNVSVTGSADKGQAIMLVERFNSVIDSCCIEQPGDDRSVAKLVDSGETVVKNSTLNVSGQTFLLKNSDVKKWGNSTSGSCPLPSSASESSAGTDDSSSDSGSTKRIRIWGDDSQKASYSLDVSGELEGLWSAEDGEVTSSSTAAGRAGEWEDGFEFTGEIEKLVVEGNATLVYDAGAGEMHFKENTTGRNLSYEAHVGGEFSRNWSTDDEDAPESTSDGQRVQGTIGSYKDFYHCTGEFLSAKVEDALTVVVEEVN